MFIFFKMMFIFVISEIEKAWMIPFGKKHLFKLNSRCTWHSSASKKYVGNKNSLVPVLKTCHLEEEKAAKPWLGFYLAVKHSSGTLLQTRWLESR